jgi:hypothetical protein
MIETLNAENAEMKSSRMLKFEIFDHVKGRKAKCKSNRALNVQNVYCLKV